MWTILWQGIHICNMKALSLLTGISLEFGVDGPLAHQLQILWANGRGYVGRLRPPLGSRGNAPVGSSGGGEAPWEKMGFKQYLTENLALLTHRIYLFYFDKFILIKCDRIFKMLICFKFLNLTAYAIRSITIQNPNYNVIKKNIYIYI